MLTKWSRIITIYYTIKWIFNGQPMLIKRMVQNGIQNTIIVNIGT